MLWCVGYGRRVCWAKSPPDGFLQFRAGDPIIAPCLRVLALGGEFSFFGVDKLECALLHCVILKEGFIDDADALRQVNRGVKRREIARLQGRDLAGLRYQPLFQPSEYGSVVQQMTSVPEAPGAPAVILPKS